MSTRSQHRSDRSTVDRHRGRLGDRRRADRHPSRAPLQRGRASRLRRLTAPCGAPAQRRSRRPSRPPLRRTPAGPYPAPSRHDTGGGAPRASSTSRSREASKVSASRPAARPHSAPSSCPVNRDRRPPDPSRSARAATGPARVAPMDMGMDMGSLRPRHSIRPSSNAHRRRSPRRAADAAATPDGVVSGWPPDARRRRCRIRLRRRLRCLPDRPRLTRKADAAAPALRHHRDDQQVRDRSHRSRRAGHARGAGPRRDRARRGLPRARARHSTRSCSSPRPRRPAAPWATPNRRGASRRCSSELQS